MGKKPKTVEPGPGHNSGGPASFAKDQLRSIVERIERLDEEQKALGDDKKEIYVEAKSNGFDRKTIRRVIQIRKQDPAERQESDALLDLYLHALGMGPAPEEEAEKDA